MRKFGLFFFYVYEIGNENKNEKQYQQMNIEICIRHNLADIVSSAKLCKYYFFSLPSSRHSHLSVHSTIFISGEIVLVFFLSCLWKSLKYLHLECSQHRSHFHLLFICDAKGMNWENRHLYTIAISKPYQQRKMYTYFITNPQYKQHTKIYSNSNCPKLLGIIDFIDMQMHWISDLPNDEQT